MPPPRLWITGRADSDRLAPNTPRGQQLAYITATQQSQHATPSSSGSGHSYSHDAFWYTQSAEVIRNATQPIAGRIVVRLSYNEPPNRVIVQNYSAVLRRHDHATVVSDAQNIVESKTCECVKHPPQFSSSLTHGHVVTTDFSVLTTCPGLRYRFTTATQQSQHATPSSSGSGHSYLQPRCILVHSVSRQR